MNKGSFLSVIRRVRRSLSKDVSFSAVSSKSLLVLLFLNYFVLTIYIYSKCDSTSYNYRYNSMLNEKTILVTGGTGSFGKEFIKIILKEYPGVKRVIVFSRDEYKQFLMSKMPEFEGNSKLKFFIGDVRDKDSLYKAFEGVDIVIHTAALKQVPACETNPFEAIKTNILGSENIISAAIFNKVKKVVALSTDKACAPVNLYGATKLCADKLFVAGNLYDIKKLFTDKLFFDVDFHNDLDVYKNLHNTKFCVVRYGNLVGSSGSVIPYFKDLIRKGAKELPITDLRMTRFWLTLEDAVDMTLMALEIMQGGELFVKKLPSMKITELANAIAPDLPLKIVGIRPGERIHEIMITKEEARNTLEFENYYVIKPSFGLKYLDEFYKDGKQVKDDFEYHSGNNNEWLTIEQMKTMIN